MLVCLTHDDNVLNFANLYKFMHMQINKFKEKNVSLIHEVMDVKLFLPGLLGFGASMVIVFILWRIFLSQKSFSFVDVVYINLDRRPDRKRHVLEQIQKNGLTNYKRYAAVDGKNIDKFYHDARLRPYYDLGENMRWDSNITKTGMQELSSGEMGCILSHRNIWEQLNQTRPVLILEDDVVFKTFKSRFKSVYASLPSDWDIFYLGYIDTGGLRPFSTHLRRTIFVYGAYAYMLSSRGVRKLLHEIPIDRPLDSFLGMLTETGKMIGYAAFPPLAEQIEYGGSASDIIHSSKS